MNSLMSFFHATDVGIWCLPAVTNELARYVGSEI